MVTEYERKIQLDKHQINKSKKRRKRRRDPTPKEPLCTKYDPKTDVSSVKKPKTGEEFENCAQQISTRGVENQKTDLGSNSLHTGQTCSMPSGSTWCSTETTNTADSTIENTMGWYLNDCITESVANISQPASASSVPCVPYSNWDFSSITFPDFQHRKFPIEVRVPASEVLREDMQCSDTTGHISRQTLKDGPETSQGHVLKSQVHNWSEYKDGVAGLSADERLLLYTPAPCLWKGDVTPLVKPHQATSTGIKVSNRSMVNLLPLSSQFNVN